MDEILKQPSRAQETVDPALLARISATLGSSLAPVRPLPPFWAMELGLICISIAVAVAGAAKAGFFGVLKLDFLQRMTIFPALGILIFFSASAWVSENIPGSRRRFTPGALLGITVLGMLAIFAVLFRDYQTHHFIAAGLVCLAVGLLHAIPTAFLGWLVLRRGFAVNSVTSGLVAGTLAGLAGLAMLELHCPNFEAPHILVWHLAVVPVSAAVGALMGKILVKP